MVEKSENEFRITILGDGGVGKSCCSLRFVTGMFTSTYDPTIEDSFTKQTNVDNKCAIIHILDTAGQQQYSVLQSIWIREGDGFIIMFDITSIKSYKKALEIHMKIMQTLDVHTYDDIAIVLVGNKVYSFILFLYIVYNYFHCKNIYFCSLIKMIQEKLI